MGNLESKVGNPKTASPSLEVPSSILHPRSSIFGFRRRWVWAVGMVLILAGLAVSALKPWQSWAKTSKEDALFRWQEAQRLIAERDLSEARIHLQHCLDEWPFNAEAHFLMARCSRRENDFARWRVHLINAEVLGWPRDEIRLEQLLWRAQTGDIWQVDDALMTYLQTLPSEAELILEALAEGYLANGMVNEIMRLTGAWMERFPEDWRPHLYRAHVYYLEALRGQAVQEYRKVLEMDPEQLQARLGLAGTLMDEGQFEEAFDHYQTFLRDSPGDPDALFGIAYCHLSLGKAKEAKETLEKLLTIRPNNVKALFVRAKVANAQESPVEALKWLRRAEAFAPFEEDISHTLAVVLRQLGKPEEADKYQKLRQEILKLHEELIEARKQMRADPRNVSLRYQIGDINRRLGRLDEAANWFETALRIDPNHGPSQKALEEISAKQSPSQKKPLSRHLPKQPLPERRN